MKRLKLVLGLGRDGKGVGGYNCFVSECALKGRTLGKGCSLFTLLH